MNKLDPSSPKTRLTDRFFNLLHSTRVSDRLLLHLLLASLIASLIWFFLSLNAKWAEPVAIPGGDITEGVVGYPRFINPLLATTRADRDLTVLLYSGVMRINQAGELVPYLAKSVTRSEDGTVYTIELRPGLTFHDGEPLTAEDVIFTYQTIQDPEVKSPLRGNWDRVTLKQQDSHTVILTLDEPYTPFINNLTVGILPEHIWANVPATELAFSPYNAEPIGAGPYKLNKIVHNDENRIIAYQLDKFSTAAEPAYLENVTLRFFPDTTTLATALEHNQITGTVDLDPKQIENFDTDEYSITVAPLPQSFGVFFNQNRSDVLRHSEVREALALSIDREKLVAQATYGQALPTYQTIPSGFGTLKSTDIASTSVHRFDQTAAIERLEKAGWERNEDNIWSLETKTESLTLSVTLRTLNTPALEATATGLARAWRSLGAEVKVEQYEQADLLNAIIRPREFEAVLFGMDVGRGVDLYPFWHSSQQTDPGLNIAQYANISADTYLEVLRTSTDEAERQDALLKFTALLREELPAIFLYTPTMQYVTNTDITTTNIPAPSGPQDRLQFITNWHREQAELWPLFHTDYAITNP